MNPMLRAALTYRNTYNFSVIPVNDQKKPLIKWEEYQRRQASEVEVKGWWDRYPKANVGIVTGKISDLAVVDIDEAEGYEEIGRILPESLVFPIAQTPSGGHHYYFRMPQEEIRLNVRKIPGCDLRAEGGYVVAPPSKSTKGDYTWQVRLKDTQLPMLPESYVKQVLSSNVVTLSSNVVMSRQVSSKMFVEGRRDNDLFHVAHYLRRANMPDDEIYQVITILANHCGFSHSEATLKVKSALERAAKRDRNLAEEIREWVLSSTGVFLSSDVVKCLQLSSRDEVKNASKVLSRLNSEKLIERHGNRNGQWRIVESDLEKLDWLTADADEFPITLPLGLHNYVKIMPKNLVVVAGAPNAGKTAFLLNIVKDNMFNTNKTINYFSSEMSEQEFKGRVLKFEDPKPEEWRVNVYNRCSNFADVIDPEAINIVDFLELHDEFWKVGSMLKDLYEKLTTGICIIALQKKRGADVGKGGDIALEKPRLYLTMDDNKITIKKGKNWRIEHYNPNDLQCEYKLVQGSRFIKTTDWEYPVDEKATRQLNRASGR